MLEHYTWFGSGRPLQLAITYACLTAFLLYDSRDSGVSLVSVYSDSNG